ncbi:MAG: proprotein convertase P-domain-containing protein [Acidimicrobiales bacterium]
MTTNTVATLAPQPSPDVAPPPDVAAAARTATFSNLGPIHIPHFGAASPYGSEITVTGVRGQLTKVTPVLFGFSHGLVADVDVLLVGPSGAAVVLMSSGGGEVRVTDATYAFDDERAPMPQSDAPASGVYEAAGNDSDHDFSGPAPAGPYGESLRAFEGLDPNGVWKLFVQDRFPGFGGSIGSWSLTIETA